MNGRIKIAVLVVLIIAVLAVVAVYYLGEESVPGAPLPDESTNIKPHNME